MRALQALLMLSALEPQRFDAVEVRVPRRRDGAPRQGSIFSAPVTPEMRAAQAKAKDADKRKRADRKRRKKSKRRNR